MELSENYKLRLDSQMGDTQQDRLARISENGAAHAPSDDTGPNDQAESQMRKALGLLGESGPRHRPDPERMEQPILRMGGVFGGGGSNGGLHRRRFVQDGDIPVTVLRRDQNYEPPAHRGGAQ